jgi:hypothetical protein
MEMGSIQKQCITHSKDTKAYISKVGFFKLVHYPRHSYMGCGVLPPNCDGQDEDIVGLIQESRVAYTKVFKGAWDNQIWKNTWKKKINLLTQYHELEITRG